MEQVHCIVWKIVIELNQMEQCVGPMKQFGLLTNMLTMF